MKPRLLLVDDEQSMCEMLETALALREIDTSWFTSAEAALETLQDVGADAVLTDLRMPGLSGIELCQQITDRRPDIPVVVMTAFGSMEAAVEAIRAGAYDFVTKPIELDLLTITLQRAFKHRSLQQQIKILKRAAKETSSFGELVGKSPSMKKLYDQLERIADTDTSVLVCGESGTGKELVARSIHTASQRKEGPFVAVNCAALPENILESELFGHAKGAFTDAHRERKGLFQQASGGTLFLDEIGEMPVSMQPKLLRALEENRARPVGGDREVDFDIRLITATNRDLRAEIENQSFREDLYFRINVIQIDLPPLRARGTDILLLGQRFLEDFAARGNKQVQGISDPASQKLLDYDWPGNVRELRNVMERAVALTRYDQIAVDDLPDRINEHRPSRLLVGADNPTELVSLAEVEQRYILHVLDAVQANKTLAARILGLDRKTLYRKLDQYQTE